MVAKGAKIDNRSEEESNESNSTLDYIKVQQLLNYSRFSVGGTRLFQ